MKDFKKVAENQFVEFLDAYDKSSGTFAISRGDRLGETVYVTVPYGKIRYLYAANYVDPDEGLTNKKLELTAYILDGALVITDIYGICSAWLDAESVERLSEGRGYEVIPLEKYNRETAKKFYARVRELYDQIEVDEASLAEKERLYKGAKARGERGLEQDGWIADRILNGKPSEPMLNKLVHDNGLKNKIITGAMTAEEAADEAFGSARKIGSASERLANIKETLELTERLAAKSSIAADPLCGAYRAVKKLDGTAKYLTVSFRTPAGDMPGQMEPRTVMWGIREIFSCQRSPEFGSWHFKTRSSAVPNVSARDIAKITYKGKTVWEDGI